MEKKKLSDIIITELFLIKADWQRTFIGSIRREADSEGNPVLSGKVIVQEGMIWSMSSDEEELRNNLDDICLMKLDFRLHEDLGVTTKIFNMDFFWN